MLPRVSIVLPAYNEARRLRPSLERIAEFCARFAAPAEVIIVVEKSSDGTLEIASEFAAKQAVFRVIANDVQRGKGFAVRAGMLAARGEYVFFSDVDLSVPIDEVARFVEYFDSHPEIEVLVGNRQHAESRILKRQTWLRQKMGQTFNRLLRGLVGIRLADTQCGFKAFRHDAAQAIFTRQQLDGFAFDVEVLLLAEQLSLRTADLPVSWINSPDSRVHLVRDSARMLWDAIRARRLVMTNH